MIAHTKLLTIDATLAVCRAAPEEERATFEKMVGAPYQADAFAIEAMNFPGYHWAVHTADDALVAVGGFIPQRAGILRTWFLGLDAAWVQGNGVTELVYDTIQQVLDRQLAHRVETITLASRTRARAWYGSIGLTYESTLRGYCADGSDAVLYVALRDPEKV